ncbi:hypothetical protein HY637_04170 [Candidatus Woesearchaeota archaeon]|nr:hypothetical protein [Candidatus Woesearchaeota archaeon]
MVELISRISKGTRMDQIYIPKERMPGFELGATVLIKPVLEKAKPKPYYYKVDSLEPIKNIIVAEILNYFEDFDNVIITGSFLEKGFDFKDIDVLLTTDKKIDAKSIENHFEKKFGIGLHVIAIGFKPLIRGLNTDPLFQMMLSKFVSKGRVLFKTKNEVNYKLLDLHLLESKALIDNFDFLAGHEKYKLTRNLIAIKLFMENKKISPEAVDAEIDNYFGKEAVINIKENLLDREFLKKYKELHNKIFNDILAGIKNGSKQKHAH